MQELSKVSIIMPVKNAMPYLVPCLDSIIRQSYLNWELIAVDDHSEDGSRKCLGDYAQQDTRIQFFENRGQGIIDALQTGYAFASGTLISRMDADDKMSADKLAAMTSRLQRLGPGHIAIGLVKYFADGPLQNGYKDYASWLNSLTITGLNFNDIYRECTIPSPCWMVWKKDFEKCNGFQSNRYPEDYDLAFRFRKEGLKIVSIPDVLHYWRDHPTRASRNDAHYADNQFTRLKIDHFLDQDYSSDLKLWVWGAGRKGKTVVRQLLKHSISFGWVTDNPKKIGLHIYNQPILPLEQLRDADGGQVIVAISSRHQSAAIADWINITAQHRYYRFS